MASTNDDFEFLFVSLRRLIITLAGEVRDFAARSASWSSEAEVMDLKMLAMVRLLDKRKNDVFTAVHPEELEPSKNAEFLNRELRKTLGESDEETNELTSELRKLMAHQEQEQGFLGDSKDWFMSTFVREPPDPDELHKKIGAIKHKCFLSVVRILKRYPSIRVFLEYEEVMPVVEGIRHYAIAGGEDGISQLPSLLRLHEDAQSFDIPAVRLALGPSTGEV